MTVVMHLLSGAMNFFEHDWLDITELIDNIDEADDDLILGRLKLT